MERAETKHTAVVVDRAPDWREIPHFRCFHLESGVCHTFTPFVIHASLYLLLPSIDWVRARCTAAVLGQDWRVARLYRKASMECLFQPCYAFSDNSISPSYLAFLVSSHSLMPLRMRIWHCRHFCKKRSMLNLASYFDLNRAYTLAHIQNHDTHR